LTYVSDRHTVHGKDGFFALPGDLPAFFATGIAVYIVITHNHIMNYPTAEWKAFDDISLRWQKCRDRSGLAAVREVHVRAGNPARRFSVRLRYDGRRQRGRNSVSRRHRRSDRHHPAATRRDPRQGELRL